MSQSTQGTMSRKTTVLKSTKALVQISMLSALAFVLMVFELPLPFAPAFYKLDVSELPVIIGAFALGPVAGVFIEMIKILLNLIIGGTQTAGVGEFANFLIGCCYVLPASIIYKRKKSKKSAIIGLVCGTLVMTAVGCLLNAYVLLPVYGKAFHSDIEKLVAMGTAVNPNINSLWSFILLAVAPFNLLKGVLVSGVTLFIYKYISVLLKGRV